MKTYERFTATDYYYEAALTRLSDLSHLRTNQGSIIFSIYCAGVSIECMLRAYITKYTREFDSKHDLLKLFEKSQLGSNLDIEDRKKMSVAINQANRIWSNNQRFESEKRIKRIIAHNNIKVGFKDVNKYIKKYNSEIFKATDLIIKIGKSQWT